MESLFRTQGDLGRSCASFILELSYRYAILPVLTKTTIREDRMMRHRRYLVGAAMGLFACAGIASTPAMASQCTNLQMLQLQHATINSATDNTSGVFVVPGSIPPTAITGLPAFCRVTATLT